MHVFVCYFITIYYIYKGRGARDGKLFKPLCPVFGQVEKPEETLTLGKYSQIRLAYALRRVGELVKNFALGTGMENQTGERLALRQWADAPVVERPLARVLCVACGAVNEEDFQFCKHCGASVGQLQGGGEGRNSHNTRVLGTEGKLRSIPEEAIQRRMAQFQEDRVSDRYQKKGNAEFQRFEVFIHSRGLEGERSIDFKGTAGQRKLQQPSVLRASPRDVLAYLIMKDVDNSGRTLVHSQQCNRLGEPNVPSQKKNQLQPCTTQECAWRHSGESLRTGIVQMIANGYAKLGVKSIWDPENRTGNPATAKVIGQYIKFSKKEQGLAGITPRQAAIILRQEAETLVMRMRSLMMIEIVKGNAHEELVLRMCMADFMTAFSSTKRGESLCNILILKIMRLPLSMGLVLNLTWGKTLRDGGMDTFGLAPNRENKWVCPVQLIDDYVACAKQQGYDMRGGYLFSNFDPATKKRGKLAPAQMSAYLNKFLKKVGLSDSEQGALSKSMHSFRAGGAICKILEGDSLEKVMREAYWKCPATALHYLKVMEVLCPMGMAKPGISPQGYKALNEMPLQQCAKMCQAYA